MAHVGHRGVSYKQASGYIEAPSSKLRPSPQFFLIASNNLRENRNRHEPPEHEIKPQPESKLGDARICRANGTAGHGSATDLKAV